jgi:hypothetical protein
MLGRQPFLGLTDPRHFFAWRLTHERECWKILDWGLNSENDSRVTGQPSFLSPSRIFSRVTPGSQGPGQLSMDPRPPHIHSSLIRAWITSQPQDIHELQTKDKKEESRLMNVQTLATSLLLTREETSVIWEL